MLGFNACATEIYSQGPLNSLLSLQFKVPQSDVPEDKWLFRFKVMAYKSFSLRDTQGICCLTFSSQSSFTARLLGFRSYDASRENGINLMHSEYPTHGCRGCRHMETSRETQSTLRAKLQSITTSTVKLKAHISTRCHSSSPTQTIKITIKDTIHTL